MMRCVVVAVGMLFAVALHGASLPWEVWTSPAALARLDAGDSVVQTSSRCPGGCRYDRSNPGAEDPLANPYPLRWLYRTADEVVLLDEPGAGALTRLWLTTGFGTSACIDPAIELRLYVDGAGAPTLALPLAALFDGSTVPFTVPLVTTPTQSSGGYTSYMPIAYAHGLRLALAGAQGGGNPCTADGRHLLWYQLQHHRIGAAAQVRSFGPGHDEPGWRSFLAHAGEDPWDGLLLPDDASLMVAPGAQVVVASRAGSGWVRGIRIQAPRASYGLLALRVRIDATTALDMPLADFFATPGDAQLPARGVLLGEDANGWLYAWWPMPFTAAASVELHALPGLVAPVAVSTRVSFDAAPVAADAGRFSASLREDCVTGGAFVLEDAIGAGKVVGVSASYHAADAALRTYLEGDEAAWIDGARAPSWYGTGVEDFYNAGFYFDHGAFAGPLAGATRVDPDGSAVTSAYRLLLVDALPYASALRMTQEAGLSPLEPTPACARRVLYAYRQTQPLQVGLAAFEVGDAAAAAAHAWLAPAGTQCEALDAQFEGEPAATRSAVACASTSGATQLRFTTASDARPLRLRRTFDVGAGEPGVVAGSAGARILVNGVPAGAFAAVAANPLRRWQEQDVPLEVAAGNNVLDVVIEPDYHDGAPVFSQSRWELRGRWQDLIFADAFEAD
ncbi:MAG: DUF2961 domain-containing protein [Dokdonella sp.]|nr:MAG: DUF2961 domain-containing protein [Dokdonella sp.]